MSQNQTTTTPILDALSDALRTIDPHTYYGAVDRTQITESSAWDYTVFGRSISRPAPNRTGKSQHFDVVVVRENYIPEDLEDRYIDAVLALKEYGFRQYGDAEYSYDRKGQTNVIVEIMTLHFERALKRCSTWQLPQP